MSEYPHALVYRGAIRRPEEVGAVAPARRAEAAGRVGIWDLSLLLGDLPELIAELTPRLRGFALYTVTAPVPAGLVAPGPCLAEARLRPHALRVARRLDLDRLIALTPYPLSNPDCPVAADGLVAVVSIATEFASRGGRPQRARRALAAALGAMPPGLAAAMAPLVKSTATRRLS